MRNPPGILARILMVDTGVLVVGALALLATGHALIAAALMPSIAAAVIGTRWLW